MILFFHVWVGIFHSKKIKKKKERARQEKMNNTFRSKEIKQRILGNIAHQSELTASEAPGYLLKISIMGSQLRLTESESPRRAV